MIAAARPQTARPALPGTPAPQQPRRRLALRDRLPAHVSAGPSLLLVGAAAILVLFVLLPLGALLARSLTGPAGEWVGLRNLLRYFAEPRLAGAALNSLLIAGCSSVLATGLAFGYALALTHARVPLRAAFRVIALLPLYAPTMLFAIGLIYLLGNQGLLTLGGFGTLPFALSVDLYGPLGIVLAHTLVAFPAAFMMLHVPLAAADGRLYEAAGAAGASRLRTFAAVTLPACRFALFGALAIGVALSVTDFGVPKILGGHTRVLAVDVYQQVVGRHDLSAGAVASTLLLSITAAAFALERLMRWRQGAAGVTARSTPHVPRPGRPRDAIALAFCSAVAAAILLVAVVPLAVSVVNLWPYSLSNPAAAPGGPFSLRHLRAAALGGAADGGPAAFLNSLRVAAYTAVAGTAFTFVTAYLVEKTRAAGPLRRLCYGLCVAPVGVPGLALGLAFVLVVGPARWAGLPNPLAGLYGTAAVLVVCNVVHFIGVSFRVAVTALRQLDPEFEQAAASMGARGPRLFLRVTVPLCAPAVLEIATYYFISAMTTVSAVIFLYSPDAPLASVAVVHLDDAGQTQAAAAACGLILVTNLLARAGVELVPPLLRRRPRRAAAA